MFAPKKPPSPCSIEQNLQNAFRDGKPMSSAKALLQVQDREVIMRKACH